MIMSSTYISDKVTIGIPCYNHQKYIEFCLNSIKAQNFNNKEILIIDDGSTDNSTLEIERWISENPNITTTLIKNKNHGLNFTLNQIVAYCNTEYLCLLASDDALYTNESISYRVELLKQNPLKLAVIGDAKVIDGENNIILDSAIENLYNGNKDNYTTDEKLQYSIINEFSIPGPVLLVKRELYDKIGLYPNIFAEDIYFYLRVIGLGLLIFLDKPVSLYRKHQNNTGGNIKYAKQINKTFVFSYLKNIKYYKGKLRLQLLKKLIGQIYVYLKLSI